MRDRGHRRRELRSLKPGRSTPCRRHRRRHAHTTHRVDVLAEEDRCRAVLFPELHEDLAAVFVDAADHVVLTPSVVTEAHVDGEGGEHALARIGEFGIRGANATLVRWRALARKEAAPFARCEGFDETLFHPVLGPGHGRFIG